MGGGSKPKADPTTTKLNQLTLARIEREEKELAENKAERERLLSAGRVGRSSLLTSGFTGPRAGAVPKQASAIGRAEERGAIRERARNRTILTDRKKGSTEPQVVPFSQEQLSFLQSSFAAAERPSRGLSSRGLFGRTA